MENLRTLVRRCRSSALILSLVCLSIEVAWAQDLARGRALFSELASAPTQGSCISCHGDPAHNTNNVLSAAGDPNRIVRAVATVSAMGFLRAHLVDADFVDLAAYLGSVVAAGANTAVPELVPSVDYAGQQQTGSEGEARQILIANSNAGPLALSAVLSTRPDKFRVVHDCPVLLNAGTSCSAQVAFRPGFVGNARALISIIDPNGRTLRSVTMAGAGTASTPPVLTWQDGRPQFSFGTIAVGASARQSAILVNANAQAVALQAVRVAGAQASSFLLTGSCASLAELKPGDQCAVDVEFKPDRPVPANAWIELVAAATSPPLLRLSGAATATPTQPPPAASSPAPATPPAGPGSATAGASGGGASGAWWLLLMVAATRAVRGARDDRRACDA